MEENSGSNGETNDMHSSNVMQSSHVNEEVESNSSDTDPSDNEGKHDNPNNEEKEDMIAMEENCKLRDLPCDTVSKVDFLKKPIRYFQLLQVKGANQFHSLLTNYSKSLQILKNSQVVREDMQIQTDLPDLHYKNM